MDTQSVQLTAMARGEIAQLAQENGNLSAREMKQRLESILAMMDNVADDSATKTAATKLFNIYELVKAVFENLSFADLITAQKICRTTREVATTSSRLRGASVYGERLRGNTAPFKPIIDFDLTLSDPDIIDRVYLVGTRPWYSLKATRTGVQPHLMHLTFDMSLPRPNTWHTRSPRGFDDPGNEHMVYERTVIVPAARDDHPEGLDKPLAHDALELWRHVTWQPNTTGQVKIAVRSKCDAGHFCEDIRLFPADLTLSQTFDWLQWHQRAHRIRKCPGSHYSRVHHRHICLQNGLLRAHTTSGEGADEVLAICRF